MTLPVKRAAIARLGAIAETVRRRKDGDPPLAVRATVACADVAAICLAWGAALGTAEVAAAAAAGCLVALAVQGRARHRAGVVQAARVVRAVLLGGALAVAAAQVTGARLPLASVASGSLTAFALLIAVRAAYKRWLLRERTAGRYLQPVVVVAEGTVAPELLRVTAEHPEAGLRIAGVVEPSPQAPAAIAQSDASGAIVVVSDIPADHLDPLLHDLLGAGLDVYVASGLDLR